jgi:hypothetical protein
MKRMVKLHIVMGVVATLLVCTSPLYAASSDRTVTESQINESYWVTNPRSRVVSSRQVDLQPGQVVLIETWNLPRKGPIQWSWTYTPSIENGRVNWTLMTATQDGQPISADLQDQINARVSSSWTRWVKNQLPTGQIESVTITEDEIIYTLARD